MAKRSTVVCVALLAPLCTTTACRSQTTCGRKPWTETVNVYRPVLELNIDDLI